MDFSALEKARHMYEPKLPQILQSDFLKLTPLNGEPTTAVADEKDVQMILPLTYGMPHVTFSYNAENLAKETSPMRIGILLSGGQAAGGHNVIAGLFDSMKRANPQNILFGFKGGPQGLIDENYIEITEDLVRKHRNSGGFDMIQSGRTKLEGLDIFEQVAKSCQKLALDAVVVVGGDDSNTNAALLAEYFLSQKVNTRVIGCPKTIDGDLKNSLIETSFGFDTACRTYSELIGNIARDACSAQKYWHFIRLMGRAASHITLECGLQTHPNVCLISEEVAEKKMSLDLVVKNIADAIITRSKKGLHFGIVLVPEGLIEFIPEMTILIHELNSLLAHRCEEFNQQGSLDKKIHWISSHLPSNAQTVYNSLPPKIQEQLILDRDPHGNIQVSAVETERLLMDLVYNQIHELTKSGKFKGSFKAQGHFFGYEGRAAFPTNFDANYCYALGYTAFLLATHGYTGYMSCIHNLSKPFDQWIPSGIPLTTMMNIEERHGKRKPVIRKALVDLKGKPFQKLVKMRAQWAENTDFLFPGPIQYYGPTEVCDQCPMTLQLEKES